MLSASVFQNGRSVGHMPDGVAEQLISRGPDIFMALDDELWERRV